MLELYEKMKTDFANERELVSVKYQRIFQNASVFHIEGNKLFFKLREDNLVLDRWLLEQDYYLSLQHQLFHKLNEIKAYSPVNIFDTRRLIVTSDDCISMIQILVREDIHINVHFRSSDFDGCLPCDLMFLSRLVNLLIDFLFKHSGLDEYSEIDEDAIVELKSKKIQLHLTFGSLHRTK